ncbi:hypothetical protein RUND412_004221 [Rhizina undulata]
MDFAPYQSEAPEASRQSLNFSRPTSPPVRPITSATNGRYSPLGTSSPSPVLPVHSGDVWGNPGGGVIGGGAGGGGWGSRERETVNLFETSLPIRLDWEAVMAYVCLPPAGGVLLLILEHKSDYVRFHAWQSSLLFAFLVVLHVIFSWSTFFSYLLLFVDLTLIGYLSINAYRDADTLDRCEIPFFGQLANSILDDE